MNKQIKSFVDSYSPSLYSFNWQLYLDEQRASKMTEEALTLFLQALAENLTELEGFNKDRRFLAQLKLFKSSYELFLNSHEVSGPHQDYEYWSRLGALERSALFLKHKCSLSYKDMENIYQIPAATLINSTHQAREFLLEGRRDLC